MTGPSQTVSRFQRVVPWLLAIPVTEWCYHRASQFQLHPLDAPGTLHPLLWRWYVATQLFRYPNSYIAELAWMAQCLIVMSIPVALALLCHYGKTGNLLVRSRGIFLLSVALCLFWCRFPLLLGKEMNVDEIQFTAAATALYADPVYGRAADCHSSGPLNISVLALPAIGGFSPDYASSRAIGLLTFFGAIAALYYGFRRIASEGLARLMVLPALGFYCTATHPDFVHYSSEHLPTLAAALAVCACLHLVRSPKEYARPMVALGFLVTATFFAKMQAVPLVAAAAAIALSCVYITGSARGLWRPVAMLAIGCAPLLAIQIVLCTAFGLWKDYWIGSIVSNWNYIKPASSLPAEVLRVASLLVVSRETWILMAVLTAVVAASVHAWLREEHRLERCCAAAVTLAVFLLAPLAGPSASAGIYAALFILLAVAILWLAFRGLAREGAQGWTGILAVAMLAGGIVSIYTPHNNFPHYLLLLVVPVCTTLGWLAFVGHARPGFLVLVFFLFCGCGGYLFAEARENLRAPVATLSDGEGQFVRTLVPQGSGLAVWGWHPKTFLEAGMRPATRDTISQRQFFFGADVNAYFRARFVLDLRRSSPELFIDALEVSCCNFTDRAQFGFEKIPEIRDFVFSHYVLTAERQGQRYYLRRDLAAATTPHPTPEH